MQTLTEIVAAVVVHSSAVAYSHFGVAIESPKIEHPAPAERTIARTATPKPAMKNLDRLQKTASQLHKTADQLQKASDQYQKASDCLTQKAQLLKT